jgi:hypothetical protein
MYIIITLEHLRGIKFTKAKILVFFRNERKFAEVEALSEFITGPSIAKNKEQRK